MSNFKDSDIKSIIEGFQIFGSETNGLINPNELKEIMKTMDMEEKNPFLFNIIEKFCLDPQIKEKGGIEAEDFIFKLEEELDDISSLEGLNNLFSIFFNPVTNKIPITTFAQIAKNVGEEENEEKLQNLINQSKMGDKELNFEEFNEVIHSETEFSNKHNNDFVYKKKPSVKMGENNYNNYNKHVMFNNTKNKNNNKKKHMITYDNNKYNINEEIIQEKKKTNIYISNYNDINDDDNNNDVFIEDNEYENFNYNKNINNFDNINYNNKINNDVNSFDYVKNKDYENNNIEMKIEEPKEETFSNNKYYSIVSENKDLDENEIYQLNNLNEEEKKKSLTQKYSDSKKKEEYDIDIDNDNLGELEMTIKTRHTKGRIEDDENEEENNNNDINQENNENNDEINDLKSNKRYHRRYRDIKSNNSDKKEEKLINSVSDNKKNIKGRNTYAYSKYRRNNK